MSEHAPEHHVAAGEPHHAPVHTATAFNESDLTGFKSEDFSAGRAVVILMLGIFLTGVFIYSVVAYWVMFFSHG